MKDTKHIVKIAVIVVFTFTVAGYFFYQNVPFFRTIIQNSIQKTTPKYNNFDDLKKFIGENSIEKVYIFATYKENDSNEFSINLLYTLYPIIPTSVRDIGDLDQLLKSREILVSESKMQKTSEDIQEIKSQDYFIYYKK